MNTCSFVGRSCHFPILRFAVVTLAALAWSSPVFGGEIHDAAQNGDLAKVRALVKANPDLVSSKDTEYGGTPLLFAVAFGQKEVAQFLLANKADINALDNDGETPLYAAARLGKKAMVELLLAKKADVNAKDNNGGTPLLAASGLGQTDVVGLLLANKADVNTKDKFGGTPLHAAAVEGYMAVVRLLLASKADVNVTDNEGLTPLHMSTFRGHIAVAELLLANKADVNAKDNDGGTPLHAALIEINRTPRSAARWLSGGVTFTPNGGYLDLAELLRQHGGHE